MSDHLQSDRPYTPSPRFVLPAPTLPRWLARRLLRSDETITFVRGPRWTPSWECYVTHPLMFFVALLLAAASLGVGWLCVPSWDEMPPAFGVTAVCIVLGSIFVLGIFAGYFTRLVVTNFRVFIVQGVEVCRTWNIEDLPRHLLRFEKRQGVEEKPTIDLDAVRSMLGGSSDQFAASKTILAFGKQLKRITTRKPDQS